MSLRDYFLEIERIIFNTKEVFSQKIKFEERTKHLGYIKAEVIFIDGSKLFFSEYIDTKYGLKKLKYSYHYMRGKKHIFRYDNSEDKAARNVNTYPRHKHIAKDKIVAAGEAKLETIIEEIRTYM
jgi:hypothetical protein